MAQIENIRDLEILAAFAQTHSFTETAYELNLSQPTISLAIKRLEKQLGKPLVERRRFGAGGVQLTEAGLVAVAHVQQVLTELDTLGLAVSAVGQSRTRRIGLPPIISSLLAWESADSRPLSLAGLTGSLSLQTVGSGRLLDQMRQHQVDYGAVAAVEDQLAITGVETRKMITYPFGLAGSQSLISRIGANTSGGIAVNDLAHLPESVRFVTLNHEFIHAQASDALLRQHIPASRIIEVADLDTLKAITAAGIALSFITSAGVDAGEGISFLPFTDAKAPQFNIYLFHDRDRATTPGAEADIQAFTHYASHQLASARF
ncbi:LysR family transcriptional regulator [Bombiscardovia nodaiensis]|uniref:LysR family transcriptional regulator n=1 Tax=Bombiscardovia nodaiensis TaxID=2932181 RepID=A0ABM8B8P9_9BIFI|nr:LysR family transcriptional regulator [Bombiscardovia nodaiensis]